MSYNTNVTLLNPTLFVNDENLNKPLLELQNNDNYILNFVNGNRNILPLIFGNLWDYTKDGNKFLNNGGNFNSYKKCHVWRALNEFKIVNDTDIEFDGYRCVYKAQLGAESVDVPNPKWIEREVYIPEVLRNQNIILSIKAAGSSVESNWQYSTGLVEKIGIEVIGSTDTINEFFEVGPWEDFSYFTDDFNSPRMTTITIPFKVDIDTTSVKIKIFRIASTIGYLHIDKIYIGGLALPYDTIDQNTLEPIKYNLAKIDINGFYDFHNGITKVNATTVLGHKASQSGTSIPVTGNSSDLVTYHGIKSVLRDILLENSTISYTAPSSSANLQYLNLFQGQVACNVDQRIYKIDHGTVKQTTVPTVTLIAPSYFTDSDVTGANSSFFIHAVYDINPDYFKVVLSDSPIISGYKLAWSIGNAFSPLDAVGYIPTPLSTIGVETTGNSIIFKYESEQFGV